MSQIFSYNFDNNINLRSNSLITNELHVKDPITGDYKAIVPNNNEDVVEVPYYADTSEINFGINATKITSSKAEFRDTTTRHSEVNFSNLKIHNAGAETKYQVGAISWKDSEAEDEKTMLLSTVGDVVEKIAPIEYLKNDSIEFETTSTTPIPYIISKNAVRSSYISAPAIRMSNSTNHNSAINFSMLTSENFRINGSTTLNYTEYANKEIKSATASNDLKRLNLPDIMDAQTNYLKPDKIEFANGSGLSQGLLHYVDDDSTVKSKSIKDLGAVPSYIQPEGIRFQNLFEDQTYPIEVKRNSNNVYARIRNNQIGLINALYGYSSELGTQRLTLRDPDGDDNVTTEYGNDEMRVIYGDDPRIYLTTATRDVINVTNNLKGLTVDADQINTAVAGGGGSGLGKFQTANDNSALTSTNINTSLVKMKDITSTAEQIDAAVSGRDFSFYIMNWSANTSANRVMKPSNSVLSNRTLLRLNSNVITESRRILFRFNNYPTGNIFSSSPPVNNFIEFSFEVAGLSTHLPRFSVEILDVMTGISPNTTIHNSFTAIPMRPTWITTSPNGWLCKWILFQTGPNIVNFDDELLEMTAAIRFYRTGTSNSSDMVNYL